MENLMNNDDMLDKVTSNSTEVESMDNNGKAYVVLEIDDPNMDGPGDISIISIFLNKEEAERYAAYLRYRYVINHYAIEEYALGINSSYKDELYDEDDIEAISMKSLDTIKDLFTVTIDLFLLAYTGISELPSVIKERGPIPHLTPKDFKSRVVYERYPLVLQAINREMLDELLHDTIEKIKSIEPLLQAVRDEPEKEDIAMDTFLNELKKITTTD